MAVSTGDGKLQKSTIRANFETLKRRRYTHAEFCAVCDLSNPTLRKKLANPELFTIKEINAIAELTHTKAADLLTRLLEEM